MAIKKLWWWVFWGSLLPLLGLVWDIAFERLGANPIQALHIRLGDWALRFLWLTLTVTPLQTLMRLRGVSDLRQLLGLYAFFYATLHVLVYLAVDHAWDWPMIIVDTLQSQYIWLGVIAYAILLLLALTSPGAAKKKLGKLWKKVHRFIYVAAITAILHYFWQLKTNLAEPLFYLITILLLLSFRVVVWFKNWKSVSLAVGSFNKTN